MTKRNKAFTLIELLVVVLIIGILSAVAVPGYQKVVGKTKAALVLSQLEEIIRAEEIYYLANNEYTTNFNDLDIHIAADSFKDYTFQSLVCGFKVQAYPRRHDRMPILQLFASQSNYSVCSGEQSHYHLRGQKLCIAGEPEAVGICKALGGTQVPGEPAYRFYLPGSAASRI